MRAQEKQILESRYLGKGLVLENISFSWKAGSKALDKCSFTIPRPGLWMIVGGNGSGKSTLFRLISGLIRPQHGHIFCSLKPALMLQNPDHHLLLPSCASDLLLSIPLGLNPIERNKKINFVLKQVGLENFADRPIHTLSGGQKQRLSLAGSLLSQSNLLLLDEPTALLDPLSQKSILEIVRKISRKSNEKPITALWITHRLEELTYCDGAAIMSKGQLGQWFSGEQILKKLN